MVQLLWNSLRNCKSKKMDLFQEQGTIIILEFASGGTIHVLSHTLFHNQPATLQHCPIPVKPGSTCRYCCISSFLRGQPKREYAPLFDVPPRKKTECCQLNHNTPSLVKQRDGFRDVKMWKNECLRPDQLQTFSSTDEGTQALLRVRLLTETKAWSPTQTQTSCLQPEWAPCKHTCGSEDDLGSKTEGSYQVFLNMPLYKERICHDSWQPSR